MRRNVRNITLVGVAALVLGGVVVASSGRFDSASDTDGERRGRRCRRGLRRTGNDDPRLRAGGCHARERRGRERGSARSGARRSRGDAATSASRQADVTDGAKIIKTADLTVSMEKGTFTGAFCGGEPHRDGERWVRRELVDVDDGRSRATRSRSTTRARSRARTVERARASSRSGCRPRSSTPPEPRSSGLGEVDNETINGQDVSSQLVDLGARITSLKAEEAAFQTLLGKATEIGDILQIQDQLFKVRTQIEQLEAEQANLNDQATFSTITVSMYEPGVAFTTAPEPEPSILSKAWDDATGGALNVLGGMVVILGYAMPLAALALVGWGAWSLTGPWRRRRRSAEQPLAVES